MSASTTSPPGSPLSLAQTMGFSSFGAKPNPKKKRKLEQSGSGSGSNSLPLGTGRRQESELASKKDIGNEQTLAGEGNKREDFRRRQAENNEDGDAGTTGEDMGATAPHNLSRPSANPPRARNTDPSPELRESHTAEFNDTNDSPDLHVPSRMPPFHPPNSLPPRPPPPTSSSSQNVQSQSQPQWPSQTQPSPYTQQSPQSYDFWALRKGIRDENGDMAYYDESFVEDPWRALGI
ncbi:hypothetical protein MMC22_011448 [Lobaria immixta]|nr:hypothetical protein [Lobaria immixta]